MKVFDNLFQYDRPETKGEFIFFKLFEFLILYQVLFFAWDWGNYIPALGDVILPLGIAHYLDISFMFGWIAWLNAALITLFVLWGFLRQQRFPYFISFLLFHLQYTARFSQGEISHGANLTGMSLLALGLAYAVFSTPVQRRKTTIGLVLFFVGIGYTSAAFTKLIGTGFTWPDGRHLWLWIAERATDRLSQSGSFQFNAIQEIVLQNYGVATLFLVAGWITEFLGFALWFRKIRSFIAVALIGLHFGVLISMNISFSAFVEILIIIGFPWYKLFDFLLRKKPDSMFNHFIEKQLGYR